MTSNEQYEQRERIAIEAMNGMFKNPYLIDRRTCAQVASMAVEQADALIEELNKEA